MLNIMRCLETLLCFTLLTCSWGFMNIKKDHPTKELWNGSSNNSLKIINGTQVTPHSAPYQAFLEFFDEDNKNWNCSGSLISTLYVVTAGSCVMGLERVEVLLGVSQISKANEPSRQRFVHTKVILHERYNETWPNYNDIALIKLPYAATLNKYVQVIPMATNTGSLVGSNAMVYGWGLLDWTTKEQADYLMEGTITIVDSENNCTSDNNLLVCAMPGPTGQSPCNGDKGGPLVMDSQLIGITTLITEDCLAKPYYGFTRVSGYLDWIHNNMKKT